MTDAEVVARVQPSVVRIDTPDSCGTGVQVAGGILTAEHVVHGEGNIQVRSQSGTSFHSNVLRADTNADVALISGGPALPALDLDFVGSMRIGDPVLVLGYPKCSVLGGTPTFIKGSLSAVRKEDSVMYVPTDAAINPRDSGGPLLNQSGHIVRIVEFGSKDTQGLGFGVASETFNVFLSLPSSLFQPRQWQRPHRIQLPHRRRCG